MRISGKPLQILIIDADQETLTIAKYRLEKLRGVKIATAVSGAEGIKAAETLQPELILLAEEMPDTDGFTLLQKLRKIPGIENTAVIFLSLNKSIMDVKKYKDAGVSDVIFKPIDPLLFPSIVKGAWISFNRNDQ